MTYATGCCGSGVAILPWLGTRGRGVGRAAPRRPSSRSRSFPLVPAPYEGRPWFLPFAGEYWKAKDRLAARRQSKA